MIDKNSGVGAGKEEGKARKFVEGRRNGAMEERIRIKTTEVSCKTHEAELTELSKCFELKQNTHLYLHSII